MITRLVEPEKGNIYLLRQKQKYNLLDIDPVNIYTNIGYFYQEPLVFDGTVKENVTL
jgi:ABC-type multidrug transport system fused ATPase/permease subunit